MTGLIPVRRRGRPKSKKESIKPTPQTVAKLQRDEVTALFTEGELNPDQERAARKIRSFTMALRHGSVPTSNLKADVVSQSRRPPRAAAEKLNDREATHWTRIYKPWANVVSKRIVARRPPLTGLSLVERVVNENCAPSALAKFHGVDRVQLLNVLRDVLDLYNAQKR